jgi:hypothetical protein
LWTRCRGLGQSYGVQTDCGWASSAGSIDTVGWDGGGTSSRTLGTEMIEAEELQWVRHGVGGCEAGSTSSRMCLGWYDPARVW